MFWIIGADGIEYGPVAEEQIRQWILDGRANAQTRARRESTSEWIALGEFPEFAERVDSQPAESERTASPPLLPPISFPAGDLQTQEAPRPDIANLFQRSLDLLKIHFLPMVAATGVVLLVYVGLQSLPVIGWIVSLVLVGPLWGGLWHFYLQLIRGQRIDLAEIFTQCKRDFQPLVLAGVVSILLSALGLLLFILPGIYLMTAWTFVLPLTTDANLGLREAMRLSRKVVQIHWWNYFLLSLVFVLLVLGGLLLFVVGTAVTTSLGMAMLAYAYEDVFDHGARARSEAPPAI